MHLVTPHEQAPVYKHFPHTASGHGLLSVSGITLEFTVWLLAGGPRPPPFLSFSFPLKEIDTDESRDGRLSLLSGDPMRCQGCINTASQYLFHGLQSIEHLLYSQDCHIQTKSGMRFMQWLLNSSLRTVILKSAVL